MRTRTITALLLSFALLAATAGSAVASPIRFNFTFAGGAATATGFITFESALLPNPGGETFDLPSPAVLDLQVTVSGATAGNGTFTIGDFQLVAWYTHGATLDLGRQLVGQPEPGGTWGTPGTGADFNLFSLSPPTPAGVKPFTLGANHGAANEMVLASMAPPESSPEPIPALGVWTLVVLAMLVGGGGIVLVQRRPSIHPPG